MLVAGSVGMVAPKVSTDPEEMQSRQAPPDDPLDFFRRALGNSGTHVDGTSDSPLGYGVFGRATATSGTNYGVAGTSVSPDGYGVFGRATATSGNTFPV